LYQSGFLDHLEAGDLEISDPGFFNIDAFADMDEKGAFYLSRLRSDVKLYQVTNNGLEEFDLVRFVKKKGHKARQWIKILAGFNLYITNARPRIFRGSRYVRFMAFAGKLN